MAEIFQTVETPEGVDWTPIVIFVVILHFVVALIVAAVWTAQAPPRGKNAPPHTLSWLTRFSCACSSVRQSS